VIVSERSSWLSMVFRIRGSVVTEVWPRIALVTALSVAFTYLQRWETFHVSLTVTPFVITGLPLGIILGFRNSASYERFWEGRKLWGALTNASRAFVRQLETHFVARTPEDTASVEELRREATLRLIAFVQALRMHLRREPAYGELAPLLGPEEVRALEGETTPPAAILHRLGEPIRVAAERGWLRSRNAVILEGTLTTLTDVLGGCDRIKKTPTPMSYLVFIHRAVAFFCFLLPFGVADTVHRATPLVVFFVSYALFSLDAIGDELDDPFRVGKNTLPIAAIARDIEIEARRRLGDRDLPPRVSPVDGVLS